MSVHGVANGRVQRVLEHLAKHPQGVTVRELIIQTEPGCKLANMASSLTAMINAGRIVRVGEWGSSVYRLKPADTAEPAVADTAPAPARTRKKAEAAPKLRAARAAKPAAAETPARPLATPARDAAPFNEPRVPTSAPARSRRDCPITSDELAAHVAEFLAQGGQIERLPMGATSHPLNTHPLRAANDAAWRERELLLANLKLA